MKDHPIWKFLKDNGNLNKSQISEIDFVEKYADPAKAKDIWLYFREIGRTQKNEQDFYNEYFSVNSTHYLDVKKKKDAQFQKEYQTQQKPSGPSSGSVSQGVSANQPIGPGLYDAGSIQALQSKIETSFYDFYEKAKKTSGGAFNSGEQAIRLSEANKKKDEIISYADQLSGLSPELSGVSSKIKTAVDNIYKNSASQTEGTISHLWNTEDDFLDDTTEDFNAFGQSIDYLANYIDSITGESKSSQSNLNLSQPLTQKNLSPEEKARLEQEDRDKEEYYRNQKIMTDAARGDRITQIPTSQIARDLARKEEGKRSAIYNSPTGIPEDKAPSYDSRYMTPEMYADQYKQWEEKNRKEVERYYNVNQEYFDQQKALIDQETLDNYYDQLNSDLIESEFLKPVISYDEDGNAFVEDVNINWENAPSSYKNVWFKEGEDKTMWDEYFPGISSDDAERYKNKSMPSESYLKSGNNFYYDFEKNVKAAAIQKLQDYYNEQNASKKKSEAVIDKIVEDNFNENSYGNYIKKADVGIDIVDVEKLNKDVDEIVSHYGIDDSGKVRAKLYNKAKASLDGLIKKDRADARAWELNPDLMRKLEEKKKSNPDEYSNTKEYIDLVNEAKQKSAEITQMYGDLAQEEIDAKTSDLIANDEKLNKQYQPIFDALNKDIESRKNAYAVGQIDKMQYEAFYDVYKQEFDRLKAEYESKLTPAATLLQIQNEVYNKYQARAEKEYQSMMDGVQARLEANFEKYASIDPVMKNQLQELYTQAYQDANAMYQTELGTRTAIADAQDDYITNLITANPILNLVIGKGTFARNTRSAFSNVLKGIGYDTDTKWMTDLGNYLLEENKDTPARTENFSDIFDWRNFKKLGGQLAGSAGPGMVAAFATTAVTGGVGAPAVVQMALGSIVSFITESSQIAGLAGESMYEKTGNVDQAAKAAKDAWDSQMDIWYLYSFDALPFVKTKNIFSKIPGVAKSPVLNNLTNAFVKGTVETFTETIQEVTQNVADVNIQQGKDPWDNWSDVLVWDETQYSPLSNKVGVKQTFISVIPSFGTASGPALLTGPESEQTINDETKKKIQRISDQTKSIVGSVVSDQQRQYFFNLVDSGRIRMARDTASAMYANGQITLDQFAEIEKQISESEKITNSANEAKLTGQDRSIYSFYTSRANEARMLADKHGNDPVLSKVYEMQSKDYAQAATDFLMNKKVPSLFTVTHLDGTRIMMTDSDMQQAMNDDSFMLSVAIGTIKVNAFGEGTRATVEQFKANGKVYSDTVDEIREIPVLEDKRAQYVSSRIGKLVSSEDISRDEAMKIATDEWLQTEDGIRYTNLNNKYDQKNKQGLSSEEQQGQKPIETKPVEGAGTEEAPAGGVVQGAQEEVTTEPQAVTEPSTEQKLQDIKDGNVVTFEYGSENEVPDVLKSKISSRQTINGKTTIKVTLPKSEADFLLSKKESETPLATEPQAETEVAPAAGLQIETAPNPELVKKGRSLGLTEAQIKMMPAEDREIIATATSKEDVKPLIEKYSQPKKGPQPTLIQVEPQLAETKKTEVKPQVRPKQEQKISESQLEAVFPEPLERNDENINKLIGKKNKYNSLPKSKKSYGANLLNQIKQDARDMGLEVITTSGLNIKLIDKKSGKTVNKKGVNRAANKEFNSKRKTAMAMGWTGELGIRGLALSYFVHGGGLKEGQSELGKGSQEMKSAKKRGLVSKRADSIDNIARFLAGEVYGFESEEDAPMDAIDDIIAELQDILLSYETTADMEYDLVEMYDKAMEAQRDAAEYSSMQQANEALDNFEMSEEDLALYYESLPKLTQEEYEDYYRQNYPEAFEQEAESTDSLGGIEGQAREKTTIEPTAEPKPKTRKERLKGKVSSIFGGETTTSVSDAVPAPRRAGSVEASESSNENAGVESALSGVGLDESSLDQWKKDNSKPSKKGRIEELTQAVRDLMSGKIKFKEYYEKAKQLMPSKLMDKVPALTSLKDIVGSIDKNKLGIGIMNLNKFVKKGMKVGLRIDIPAFNNFGKSVVTVHDKTGSGQPVIGYGSTGSITNVTFKTSVPTAAKIGAGESKSAFAMAVGEWMDESPESVQKRAEEALNSPDWVQVGMNPARNSFFFDKADGNPVLSADEVLQVGNLVLAKNPKKIDLNTAEGMAQFEDMFSAKSKEGTTYQYRKEESSKGQRIAGKLFDLFGGNPEEAAEKVADFLSDSGITVEVLDSKDYDNHPLIVSSEGQGTQGMFLADDGAVLINRQKLQREGAALAFHEGIHPVINIIRNTNPKLYKSLVDGIRREIARNPNMQAVVSFYEKYKEAGFGDEQSEEEMIVETLAQIASGGIKLSQVDKSLRSKIIDFMNKIAKALGLPQIFQGSSDEALREFADKLVNAMTQGGSISDVVGAENVKEFQNALAQARLTSEEIAERTESQTKAGEVQPSMELTAKRKGEDITTYSGPASIDALRENKPDMYISRALELSKTHLVKGNVRKFSNSLTQDQKLKWADSIYAKAKNTVVSNLLFVYDNIDPDIRNISKLWYDGANIIAQEMASKYGVTLEQASAVIATQSPQKPWFDNVHLAHFILDFYTNNENTIFEQSDFDYYKSKTVDGTGKPYPNQIAYLPNLKKAIGKPFSELNGYDKSAMIRSRFDQNYERNAPLRIPTGVIVDAKIKSPSSFSGYETILKAVSVLQDGSSKNISANIGGAYKVRNFYNNIASPQTDGEVTIDTHAMAVAYMLPLGSSSKEVKFDAGTYSFFADAYREAAKQRGVLAREMQSITWEGARAIFPANQKTEKAKQIVKDIWADYDLGKTTLQEAQNKIKTYGKDLSVTDWAGYVDAILDENKTATYLKELPLASRNKPAVEQRAEGSIDRGLPSVGKGNRKPVAQPSIEGARQPISSRRLPSNIDIVNGFYSPIEKNLRETKAEKQSANKWLSGGIIGKGDEAVYTGVRQWLESKNPQEQVSKQEILDWMKENRVEINEVVKGVEDFTDESKWKKRASGDGVWETTASDGTKLTIDASEGEGVFYVYADGNEISSDNYSSGDDIFNLGVQAIESSMDYGESPTKFSQYQLEGEKENYKEVLVTLPTNRERATVVEVDGKWRIKHSDGSLSPATFISKKWAEKGLKEYIEAEREGYRTDRETFQSTHFDEPNILVHLRMNTRTDADGNKVLFLEEVQSDWGQKGKKEGFKPLSGFNESKISTKTKPNDKLEVYYENKFVDEIFTRYSTSDEVKQDVLNAAKNYFDYSLSLKPIKPAPFVTDTNAWVKLGLKMALREAISQGVDKVAWTTGEQQNERYDLSKQIEKISYDKSDNTITAWNKDGRQVIQQTAKESELPGIIGKDVADKLLKQKEDGEGVVELSGQDIKVGGKGMKAFYGQPSEGNEGIVGKVAKSLVKELTGQQGVIGETKIEKSTQASIEITPELKESVQKGMPQFSIGNRANAQQSLSDAIDSIDDAVEAGASIQDEVDAKIKSQPWYNDLSDTQKADLDAALAEEYGYDPEASSYVDSSQDVTPSESAQKIEDLYNSREKGYKNKIQDLLADDEEMKYIYNNIPKILGQLEQEGIIKKNINCP